MSDSHNGVCTAIAELACTPSASKLELPAKDPVMETSPPAFPKYVLTGHAYPDQTLYKESDSNGVLDIELGRNYFGG
jgi:hypothetical protein